MRVTRQIVATRKRQRKKSPIERTTSQALRVLIAVFLPVLCVFSGTGMSYVCVWGRSSRPPGMLLNVAGQSSRRCRCGRDLMRLYLQRVGVGVRNIVYVPLIAERALI
ncbi:MAG: hypothetical protein IANPNBLG_04116 [Bryobacteraceae bacterium]|nr:hypothetical protein [Bryobacteraceae bacterium]